MSQLVAKPDQFLRQRYCVLESLKRKWRPYGGRSGLFTRGYRPIRLVEFSRQARWVVAEFTAQPPFLQLAQTTQGLRTLHPSTYFLFDCRRSAKKASGSSITRPPPFLPIACLLTTSSSNRESPRQCRLSHASEPLSIHRLRLDSRYIPASDHQLLLCIGSRKEGLSHRC